MPVVSEASFGAALEMSTIIEASRSEHSPWSPTHTLGASSSRLTRGSDARAKLDEVFDAVATSKAFVLLLTAETLHRPWILLQAFEAILAQTPFICVRVEGGGYEFQVAQRFLSNLSSSLDRILPGECLEAAPLLPAPFQALTFPCC